MARPRRLVLHTAVSNATSLFELFNQVGNPVAHFYVREDGTVEQYVDTDRRSSAVFEGNHDSISVETWDGGHIVPWTPRQVGALAQLALWVHGKHGIPLRRLPSSRPGTTGVGWHRLGIDGNFPEPDGELLGGRVVGGELWSLSFGKACPGDPRILQTVNRVLPLARRLKEGDDVTPEQMQRILEVVRGEGSRTRRRLNEIAGNVLERDRRMFKAIDDLPDENLTRRDVREVLEQVLAQNPIDTGEAERA